MCHFTKSHDILSFIVTGIEFNAVFMKLVLMCYGAARKRIRIETKEIGNCHQNPVHNGNPGRQRIGIEPENSAGRETKKGINTECNQKPNGTNVSLFEALGEIVGEANGQALEYEPERKGLVAVVDKLPEPEEDVGIRHHEIDPIRNESLYIRGLE